MAKKRAPQRDKRTGKFLTRRQISARRAARKGKTKTTKRKTKRRTTKVTRRKGNPVAKKKRRRRRRRSSGGGMSSKQKQEVCLAAAALGYIEENTEWTASLPLYKPGAAGKVAGPVKRHLAYGLGFHFLSKSTGGAGRKWLDRASAALLTVGCFEAGQSKFSLEGSIQGKGQDPNYDVVEAVEGELDD